MPAPICRMPTRRRLKEINKRDATLETEFQQKLLAGTKAGAFVTDNKADLAGLSDAEIAAAAQRRRSARHEGQIC